ncbi:DMT family transporter [Micromonospora sp. C28SCA-DRY-2]|uniref:DMT family transporter n=1 Tax=Micromonospora sp. C28SCA-DRY-2 TaxID=3059522 RepID=UPI002676B9BE|nr:DMT family transporter [Micromonospora sp. C28SCA-DRY-2]MDO3700249.1 DMT family transporter [Micromonospora sp. C28SCA-DRY-2]
MRLSASVGAASAMLLVGTSTAVSATIAGYPVFTGQALRYALAAAILLAVVRHQRLPRVRLTSRDVLLLIALAATGLAGFNIFLVEATRHAGPAMIGSVVGAVPLVLALIGPLMQRRRPAPRTVGAALVVALGAAVAAGLGSGSLTGLLLSLGALAGEVAFSLLAVPLLPKLGPLRVAAYPAALSVPMLLAAGLVLDGTDSLRLPTPGQAAAFGYLGAIVTAAAFFLWYDALRRLGADRAGLFAGLVPVGALLTAVALGLGEAGPADVTGALLVAAGVVVGVRRPKRASEEHTISEGQRVSRPSVGHGGDHHMRDTRRGYPSAGAAPVVPARPAEHTAVRQALASAGH